jgi:hypothetical protein
MSLLVGMTNESRKNSWARGTEDCKVLSSLGGIIPPRFFFALPLDRSNPVTHFEENAVLTRLASFFWRV